MNKTKDNHEADDKPLTKADRRTRELQQKMSLAVSVAKSIIAKASQKTKETAQATYRSSVRLKRSISVKSEIAKLQKELNFRLPRDIGARVVHSDILVDGQANLIAQLRQKQTEFELAHQAGLSGDRKKRSEAKTIAKRIMPLQTQLGKNVLSDSHPHEELSQFFDSHQLLMEQLKRLNEELDEIAKDLENIDLKERNASFVGIVAIAAVSFFCVVAVGRMWVGTSHNESQFIMSAKDEDSVSKALGFVVCGWVALAPPVVFNCIGNSSVFPNQLAFSF
jgi:head-tail adaptor